MKKQIQKELSRVEKEYSIKILYACETGSRAWGFPSPNSDFDVRMLYVHPTEWYLSLDEKKDSIEIMLNDCELDITGWELRKGLRLMRKSNASMMERIQSPITYIDDSVFIGDIHALAKDCFSPITTMYHYSNMAKSALAEVAISQPYKLKKLFYALRGAIACQWIKSKQTIVPIVFEDMLMQLDINQAIMHNIRILQSLKATVDEGYMHHGEEKLILFITECIDPSSFKFGAFTKQKPINGAIDSFFQNTLKTAWK